MAFGMLSTLLSGAAYGPELGDLVSGAQPGRDGHFCLVVNIAAFQPLEEVTARVDRILDQVSNSRRATGVNALYSPGELGDSLDKEYSLNGIPLSVETLAGIIKSAEQVGADIPIVQSLRRSLAQTAGSRKTPTGGNAWRFISSMDQSRSSACAAPILVSSAVWMR